MKWVVRVARTGDPAARDRQHARSEVHARRVLNHLVEEELGHLLGRRADLVVGMRRMTAPVEGIVITATDDETDFRWVGWISLLADVQDGPRMLAAVRREPVLDPLAEAEPLVVVLDN